MTTTDAPLRNTVTTKFVKGYVLVQLHAGSISNTVGSLLVQDDNRADVFARAKCTPLARTADRGQGGDVRYRDHELRLPCHVESLFDNSLTPHTHIFF